MPGYGHDPTGRSTRRLADKRQRSRTGPPKDEPWVFVPLTVVESKPFRSLSINARRVLDRLIIEHFNHNRIENGALCVSARQFHQWGVTKDCLTPAVRELESKGLIVTSLGEAKGVLRPPLVYRITFYGTTENEPTNDWRKWTSQHWPDTPSSRDIIDVPESREGKLLRSGPRKGPKRASLSLEQGTEGDVN